MEIPRGRLLLLSGLGVVLGLLGGAAAFVLLRLIGLLTNLAFFGRVAWGLPSFSHLHASPRIVIAAVAGSLVVSSLAIWCPMIKGHGIPEAMDAVLTNQSRIAPRAALAKPLSAAVAIGTGGPFGAEGPIIVTGGALGSLLGQALHVSPAERKILLASGAAAGMAATFGTPLAAVILAIELLMFEFSVRVFVPLVVAAAVAGGVHAAVFGAAPLLHAPTTEAVGLTRLPAFVVLGAMCGLLAAVLTKGLEIVEDTFERLPVTPFWFPVIGAVGFAAIGLLQPRALGVGYDQINDVLLGRLTIGVVAGLACAKLFAWWIALGSGTSGGTLAPILLIGGAAGTLAAWVAARFLPGLGVPTSVMALVAMAATFAAATRAPFASMVFLFELTREYTIILPLMIGTVAAVLVYDALMEESLMTMKLARRGLRIRSEYHLDPMRTTLVRDVMTSDVRTLPVAATVGEAREMFTATRHGAYPLIDSERRVAGIVTRGDILRSPVPDATPVTEIASADVVTVDPSAQLLDVVALMLEEDIEYVPVIDPARTIIGICTRTDLLQARAPGLEGERRQPGWLRGSR
ncbi:MAG: chloride channel protein [Actinomycetota bacterium]